MELAAHHWLIIVIVAILGIIVGYLVGVRNAPPVPAGGFVPEAGLEYPADDASLYSEPSLLEDPSSLELDDAAGGTVQLEVTTTEPTPTTEVTE